MTDLLKPTFTIRVYGLLIHNNQILLSRENIKGSIHTKFPGGGLEYGEGVTDCVKREFIEEVEITLSKTEHFYTTEDFFQSKFHKHPRQVLSLYYRVWTDQLGKVKTGSPKDSSLLQNDDDQVLYWCPMEDLAQQPIELPIDKIVVKKLLS